MPAAVPEFRSGNHSEKMTMNGTAFHPPAEEWRQALFEHVPIAIVVSSPETGEIFAANPEACRMLGYTEVQLCALRVADLVVGASAWCGRDAGNAHLPEGQEGGSAPSEFCGELTVQRADGALLPVELNSSIFTGAEGRRASINTFLRLGHRPLAAPAAQQSPGTGAGIIQDSMPRPQLDLVLGESEQRLRAATELAALGVWSWDRNADVLTWDIRMFAIHGVSPEIQPTISAWAQMMHPDDRAAVSMTTQRVMATERQVSVEYRVVHPDGTIHSVLCSGGAIRDGAGVMTHQLGVCLDVTALRRAEESLSRLAAIVDASSDAIVSVSSDGVITSWNPSAEKLYGHRAVDVIGQELSDLVAPGQAARMPAFIERICNGEIIRLPDLIWTTPDQRKVDLAVTLTPLPNRAGHWVEISSVAHDITQRKRAEAAVAESEARLKAVIENTSDLIWSVDRQYQLLVANAACLESTQRAQGRPSVVGESILDAAGVFAAGELWLPYYDAALEGVKTRFEFESSLSAGATLECSLDPIRDEAGQVTGVAGRITDISERLSTAAHLREAVQRLRLAADAAGIGVWNWNFADDSLEWDDRMCELYGVAKSIRDNVFYYEIWRSSLHPEDLTHAETTLRDAVRTGNPWKTFFRIVLPNGSIRHIQTSSIIDYDRKGAPLRMIGINRDVTEQMSYEQFLQDTNARLEQRVAERTLELRTLVAELERANAGKDAFLAAVSHELRTPLTGVLAMAESLQEEVRGPLNEHQKRYVAAITESGDRLLRIVNSVLRYVAAVSADTPPPLERCRLADLCAVSVRSAKAKANARQLAIQMDVEPLNLEARTNGDFIIQLIDVLLDNAIKFTARQGQLGVSVVELAAAGVFQLTVWDTGIGIGEEQKAYLFQPFTQADQRLARAYEGIGLGLALAKRIVDLLGGSIELKSEVGKGSRFIVTLPHNMPAQS